METGIIPKFHLSECVWWCAGSVWALIQPCLWVKTVGCLLKHSSALMSTKSQRAYLLSELEVDRVCCGSVGGGNGTILALSDWISPTCEAWIQVWTGLERSFVLFESSWSHLWHTAPDYTHTSSKVGDSCVLRPKPLTECLEECVCVSVCVCCVKSTRKSKLFNGKSFILP